MSDLMPAASRLLDIPEALVAEALDLELEAGTVVRDTVNGGACVFLASLHAAERVIAARIRSLAVGVVPWKPIDADRAIPWVEARCRCRSRGCRPRRCGWRSGRRCS